jgi:hypothetical protein
VSKALFGLPKSRIGYRPNADGSGSAYPIPWLKGNRSSEPTPEERASALRDLEEREARGPWPWLWLAWLVAFLAVEIPAAIRKAKNDTLSEHVWRWFRGPWRRLVIGAFMVALTCHFVFGASALWLLTAVPVAALIVYAEFFERTRA